MPASLQEITLKLSNWVNHDMRVDHHSKRVIVALDFANPKQALAFIQQLEPDSCRLKVGLELFTSGGPELVKTLVEQGYEVFLDLKFHDIPNTVAAACRSAASLGVLRCIPI